MTKTEDLSTMQGRVSWFCEHFDVKPPKLQLDPEEPDAVIMTDEILAWARKEGVSLDWLVSGCFKGPLSTFREKYRADAEGEEYVAKAIDTAYRLEASVRMASEVALEDSGNFQKVGGATVLAMAAEMAAAIIEGLEVGNRPKRQA